MILIIPAAGLGTRFGELCGGNPKPMLKLWGKPILEHILRQIAASDIIDKVILVVGYKKERIIKYFGDGKDFGLSIQYVIQKNPRGTAQALGLCRKKVRDNLFFLQWSDIIVPSFWYRKLLDHYIPGRHSGIITIDWLGDWRSGAGITLNRKWDVLQIVEKPSKSSKKKFQWNNSGVFLLAKKVFSWLPSYFPKDKEIHLAPVLDKMIKSGKRFGGLPIPRNDYIDAKNLVIYKNLQKQKKPSFL